MSRSSPLGLIGLGLLGSAIADRLLQQELQLLGFDLEPDRCAHFKASGGICSASADEVFQACQTVILCLPTSQIVYQLLEDASASLQSGQTLIDATTGDPAEIVELAQRLQARGVQYLEARVCGSSQQLRTGEVALLVAGDAAELKRFEGLFHHLSSRVFPLSPVGKASQLKLVHNLILGLNRAVLAEGLQFAQSLGFDPKEALQVLLQTPAASQAMVTKGEKMAQADYTPQATLAQHLKDVELILAEAEKHQALTPLSELHLRLLQEAVQAGFGCADNSAIREVFKLKTPG